MKKYWKSIAAIVLVVAIAATVALSTMDFRLRATDNDDSIGSGEVVEQQIELTESAEEDVPTQTQEPEAAEPQTQAVEVYNTYDETQVTVAEAETTIANAADQVTTEAEKVTEATTVKAPEQAAAETEKAAEATTSPESTETTETTKAAETTVKPETKDTTAEPEGQETVVETTTESKTAAAAETATADKGTSETATNETVTEAAAAETTETATTTAETTTEEQTTAAPSRSVRLKTNLDDGTIPYEGMEVVLTVELTGFEDCQYTIKWQRSTDNENWEDIPDATEEEYRFTLTEETNGYYWNAQVTVG